MKLQRYFCLLLFGLPLLVYAQSNKTVTVSYERSAKGEVTFYSETQSHTPYTVSMTFSRLSNTTSTEGEIYDAVIHYGKTRLLTLRPSTENVPIGFSYSSRTLPFLESEGIRDTRYHGSPARTAFPSSFPQSPRCSPGKIRQVQNDFLRWKSQRNTAFLR